MTFYGKQFYAGQKDGSLRSAKEILPLILQLIKPTSIIDVGCGTGTWLSVCKELGVEDIFGIDGSYVDKGMLLFSEDRFIAANLTEPLKVGRTFDLVISMEVAEHIPKKYEELFINSLVSLGPAILFSADIPHRGGIGHVNEQWQDHWARLFKERDYEVIDYIRPLVWNNKEVMWWYAQNTLLYVRMDYLDAYSGLKNIFENKKIFPLRVVHPRLFEETADPKKMSIRKASAAIPFGIARVLKRALKRF